MTTRPLEPRDAALISETAFFRGLSSEALAQAVASARRVTLRAGQHLFRQDDTANAVYLVLSGRARVLQASADGQAVALRVVGPGELLGLVAALGADRYPVGAQAQGGCSAARWSGAELWALLEKSPGMATAALKMALSRLRELQEQYRELATERVEQRIARALVRLVRQAGKRVELPGGKGGVRIDMPLTRQDLAEMTGTTLFTVSRTLSGWEEAGLIATGRRRVVVRQPHRLVRIAEDLSL